MKGMSGKAALQEAEFSRQVRVAEAQAKLSAAKLEAEAEVTRAAGQAKANEEISGTLSPAVLQYQYIRVLEEQGQQGDRTIVYIPTDPRTGLPVNLPAPEAQRLSAPSQKGGQDAK
jgi:regulator of protease activity HflC (stomatin/prohibitin superfamily)